MPVVVNLSTTYLVPVVVPEIELLLPVKPARPVDEIENDNDVEAALKFVSPACVAVKEHVPDATIVNVNPDTVHTLVVLEEIVTAKPEEDVAESVKGVLDHVVVPGFVNEIV